MNLLEMNEMLLTGKKQPYKYTEFTTEEITLFKQMLTTSTMVNNMFNQTDDSSSFLSAVPTFKEVFGAAKSAEIFYAIKTGYYYAGVPSKLVYFINKLFDEVQDSSDYVNLALQSGLSILQKYAGYTYKVVQDGAETEFTFINLIQNKIGKSFKLITDSTPKIKIGKVSEVYIRNVDRVALLPGDIADQLSFDNVDAITYEPGVGLVFDKQPLRVFNGRLGIAMNDFDLRNCF